MTNDLTPQQILDTPMGENDADAPTVRDYLVKLLHDLWHHGMDFNTKRPFGNSGWHYEVYRALVRAGHITGQFDEDGCLDDCDIDLGDRLVREAINSLAGAS
jgi:hypothetical protein